jgi:hypothetical protein
LPKPHKPTLQPKLCQRACKANARKIVLKNFQRFKKNKKRIAQPDTTMTRKLNNDNGLQTRTTEHQLPTAVWRKGGCSASYDSFVVGSSAVLRLNFCAKNPPLRQAAKRYSQ